ncbi:hypothetical protein HDU83_003329 [Entophlyctis luteolus]|nr:hypothetical protein HDU83_003329 [Entophlyctis luteolus]
MRDDSGGGLLLAVHGTNSCKWVLRAHGDTAAMGWMDAVNRICGGLYGGGGIVPRSASLEVQNDVIAHNVTMQHSKSHNAPFTPASSTGPQLVRANSISNGRNYNGVATANGAMAAAKREARMRKEHQEYILKQQQLCEQRKLEVAMRKEMEIFERGDGLASGKSHGQTGSDEDLLRLEASKKLRYMELPRASLGSVNSTVRSPTLSDTSSPASIGGRPLIQGSISQHSSSGEILGKHFQAPLIPRAPSRSKEHNHEREALMRQQHAEYIKKQRTISEKIRQEIAMKKAVEAFQQKIVVDVRSSSPHGSKVGALAGSKPDAEEAYLRKEFAKLEGFLM